ncbi:Gfo/Idh/MocA family oxidoreductase [Streptomyces sp. NPDC046821]|uniref:Gfo/Idh/MocA family protein n=1 Tax=Streptomyces sp. NPDC046821 TaxID=3154702 RepID=UPI0033DB9EC9
MTRHTPPVRVGVLGCADIAVRRVLPALDAAPGVRVAAVASRDSATAARVAEPYGCAALTGYQAVLDRPDIDAVYVPLPAALHAEWTERALRAGKHVLAEKPLTTGLDETARLVALAGELGLVLRENFMFPHHRVHDRVRRLVAEGAVGRLRCFNAEFSIPKRPPQDIRYQSSLGGGALTDVGVYPLRVAQHFLGAGLEVAGAVLHEDPDHGVDVAGAVLLRAPDGVTAQLTFGIEHAYRAAYELVGSEGRLTVDRAFSPPADHRVRIRLEGRDGPRDLSAEPDDQYTRAMTAFATAVRTGEPDPGTAVALARLVERVRERAAYA